MGALKEQYLEDDHGKKIAVVIPISQYKKMMDNLEEYQDIQDFKKIKSAKQIFIPAEQAFKEIEQGRKNG